MRDVMLITHFIGLAMGLGTSFAHMFLGMASEKMPPDEAQAFLMKTMVLTKMGHTGITLLILSGLYLMTPYWRSLAETPLLIAKLALVVVLVTLIALITRIGSQLKKGNLSNAAKLKPLGQATLITAILIVVLAVSVFH